MKILQVVPFFSPVHGGSAIAPYRLSRELAKRGHEVTIFTSDYKLSREWVKSLRRVYPFKTRLSLASFYVTPGIMKKAEEEIKRFDVIHMHNYRTFQDIVVHYYARKYGVPYVLQARGSLPRIMAKQRLKWVYDVFFGYRLLRDASKVIALSQTEALQYSDLGLPEEKIEVIPNGIDLSEFNELPPRGGFRKKYQIEEGEKLIFFLGRIHKIKGVDVLVKSFSKVYEKEDDVRLVIAGPDDGYLHEVKCLVRSLEVENRILFTGPLYGRDKLEAYVDAEVCVLPSRYETFPNVLLEAYACSKPVIATDVEAMPDLVIDGKTGILVPSENVNALARALGVILNDPYEAKQMGKEGFRFVAKTFTIERVMDRLIKLYSELLAD